jgi:hypothetical protein
MIRKLITSPWPIYGLMAIGLLAPMASNTVVPQPSDHANHTATIVQARMALEQGQFPLRVAPWEHYGWQYPEFQFYSPFPYTVGAMVYKWVTPDNPFLAYKLLLWASLLLAGYGTYLTALLLTRSRHAAFLAGVLYMSAPYLLINVNARGAFTETIAEGLLPMVLYCSLRCFYSTGFSPWVPATGVAWALLALTHNITFVWGGVFLGVLFLSMAVERWRVHSGLWRVGAAFALGCLLSLYFLVPVLLAPAYLNIVHAIGRIAASNWLTPIAALLSPVSLPPEPMFNHATTEHLNPAIGWPTLAGVAIVLAAWRSPAQMAVLTAPHARRVCGTLVVLFALAVFMTWSPIDFWTGLPPVLAIAQFTYRFLTYVALPGALLAGFALVLLFRGAMDLRHTVPAVLLIVSAHSSYLPTLKNSEITIAGILKEPDVGYSREAYLVDPRATPADPALGGNIHLVDLYPGGHLKAGATLELPRAQFRGAFGLMRYFQGTGLSAAMDGNAVVFSIDGHEAARPLGQGPMVFWFPAPVAAEDPALPATVPIRFDVRPDPAAKTPGAPPSAAAANIGIDQISLMGLRPNNTIVQHEMTHRCVRLDGLLTCHFKVTDRPINAQLQMLYYPQLLDVRIDGREGPYFPIPEHNYMLVGVRLEPGEHQVTARFRGVAWANIVCAIAWVLTFVAGVSALVYNASGRFGAGAR